MDQKENKKVGQVWTMLYPEEKEKDIGFITLNVLIVSRPFKTENDLVFRVVPVDTSIDSEQMVLNTVYGNEIVEISSSDVSKFRKSEDSTVIPCVIENKEYSLKMNMAYGWLEYPMSEDQMDGYLGTIDEESLRRVQKVIQMQDIKSGIEDWMHNASIFRRASFIPMLADERRLALEEE